MNHVHTLERRQLLSASRLDPSFGTAGVVPGASHPTLLPDGEIVCDGGVSPVDGFYPNFGLISRLSADGQPQSGPGAQIQVSSGTSSLVGVDQAGRIIALGSDGAYRRYNPDGSVDPSFSFATTADNGQVQRHIAWVLPDGDTLVVETAPQSTDLVELGVNGDASPQPYPQFGQGLVLGTDATVNAIAANGDILGTSGNGSLFRLTPAGKLDPHFGNKGIVNLGSNVLAVVPEPNGGILVNFGTSLRRLNPTGRFDAAFGNRGSITVPEYSGAAVSSNGSIYLGSLTLAYEGPLDYSISRYNAHGKLDRSFADGGTSTGTLLPDVVGIAPSLQLQVMPEGHLLAAASWGETSADRILGQLGGDILFRLNVDAPALNGTATLVGGGTLAAGQRGALSLAVTNTGNAASTQPLTVTLRATSATGSFSAELVKRAVRLPIDPGATGTVLIPFKLPRQTPHGSLTLVLTATLPRSSMGGADVDSDLLLTVA